jgi:hypothetical protein
MKTERIFLATLVIVTGILHACEPLEDVSDVPEIHFKKFTNTIVKDTLGNLSPGFSLEFNFQDGNSDFGQMNKDSNLILIPYQKINGVYDSVDYEQYGKAYIISYNDYLDRSGSTVKGEIKVDYVFYVTPPFDTIRYNFYIIDRSGHKSNVESTTDIAF